MSGEARPRLSGTDMALIARGLEELHHASSDRDEQLVIMDLLARLGKTASRRPGAGGKWVVILPTVTGSGETGFRTEFAWDGKDFPSMVLAVSHGFTLGRADDFNVGLVSGGMLASLWWMDKVVRTSAAQLAEIAAQCGIEDKP